MPSTEANKEIQAVLSIQYEQKNRHAEIMLGWNQICVNNPHTRRAILTAKMNGTLDKWEIDMFTATGTNGTNVPTPVLLPDFDDEFPPLIGTGPPATGNNGANEPALLLDFDDEFPPLGNGGASLPMQGAMPSGLFKYGIPPTNGPSMSVFGLQTPPITPESNYIVVNGEQIRIGGQSHWPPGELDRFRATLKLKAPATSAVVVQEEKASFPTNGAVVNPAGSAAATPSGAPKQTSSERAVSVGKALNVSLTQKKSVPSLLPKMATGSTSSGRGHAVSALAKQGSPMKTKQQKTVLRVRPNPPKERTVDEDGFEAVAPKKSAPPKVAEGPKKNVSVPVAQHSKPSSSASAPPPPPPAQPASSTSHSEIASKKKDKKKKKQSEPEESEEEMLNRLIAENCAMKAQLAAEAQQAEPEAVPVEQASGPVAATVAPIEPVSEQVTALLKERIRQLEKNEELRKYRVTVATDSLEKAIELQKQFNTGGCQFTLHHSVEGALREISGNGEEKALAEKSDE